MFAQHLAPLGRARRLSAAAIAAADGALVREVEVVEGHLLAGGDRPGRAQQQRVVERRVAVGGALGVGRVEQLHVALVVALARLVGLGLQALQLRLQHQPLLLEPALLPLRLLARLALELQLCRLLGRLLPMPPNYAERVRGASKGRADGRARLTMAASGRGARDSPAAQAATAGTND